MCPTSLLYSIKVLKQCLSDINLLKRHSVSGYLQLLVALFTISHFLSHFPHRHFCFSSYLLSDGVKENYLIFTINVRFNSFLSFFITYVQDKLLCLSFPSSFIQFLLLFFDCSQKFPLFFYQRYRRFLKQSKKLLWFLLYALQFLFLVNYRFTLLMYSFKVLLLLLYFWYNLYRLFRSFVLNTKCVM